MDIGNSSGFVIGPNCSYADFTDLFADFHGFANIKTSKPSLLTVGTHFFAYFTPVILLVGMVGNCLSLSVFTTKNMKKLSASIYLAALSIADISSLVFYVLVEWLRRGFTHINPEVKLSFLDADGVCQTLLYLSYMSRCMSAWIIVAFTVERFNGVCYPLKKVKRNACKTLLLMFLFNATLVLYKPILSGEYTIRGRTACAANPKHSFVSFVLDSLFAVSISFIPFLIITTLNVFIVRKVFLHNYRNRDIFTEDTKIRLEFTFILLAISFFFVAVNLPYFVIWFRNFLNSHFISAPSDTMFLSKADIDEWNGVLLITRTIFYMNYCVNFFLYSITGASFRKELAAKVCLKKKKKTLSRTRFRSSKRSSTRVLNSASICTTYIM